MLTATHLPPAGWRADWTKRGLWRAGALDDALRASATRTPDKAAVVEGTVSVTFAELDTLVDRCVRFLESAGVGTGDAVAWQLPNCVDAVVLFFAVARLRAVSVPVVVIFRDRELTFICQQTRATVLVVPREYRKHDHAAMARRVAEAVPTLRTTHAIDLDAAPGANWPGEELGAPTVDLRPAPGLEEIAAVLYTSGTESDPKGALHSHTGLAYDSRSMVDFLGLTGDDVFFMPSPLTHVTGLLNGMVGPIILGATVVLQRDWDADRGLELIARHGVTYSVVATPFIQQMFAHPDAAEALSSLRFFRCGGADIPASLMESAQQLGVAILRVYGMTEMPTVTCVPPDAPPDKAALTDGRLIDDTLLRLAAGGDGRDGAIGEIEVAGPEIFLGYVDSSVNARAFTADGYVRTGDLGSVDADGYVTVAGRSKDIVIRGGENLSAKEIEEALRRGDHVVDVAVVGVPDATLGERACAFVVPGPAGGPGLDELRRLVLDAGLAIQKSPEHVRHVPELPRTASGKVIKAALRQSFIDENRDPQPAP
ncbi:AMP-binding protein [Blastococcus sp. URHD0036]|uniref:AMP-binding protein n=1 Tax=Blastococcus sp. URHD0036 TaxID=1380356 RepID=UPI00049718C7|nr:AMP-binding protein [Blastococcus sp. URHD0036]